MPHTTIRYGSEMVNHNLAFCRVLITSIDQLWPVKRMFRVYSKLHMSNACVSCIRHVIVYQICLAGWIFCCGKYVALIALHIHTYGDKTLISWPAIRTRLYSWNNDCEKARSLFLRFSIVPYTSLIHDCQSSAVFLRLDPTKLDHLHGEILIALKE